MIEKSFYDKANSKESYIQLAKETLSTIRSENNNSSQQPVNNTGYLDSHGYPVNMNMMATQQHTQHFTPQQQQQPPQVQRTQQLYTPNNNNSLGIIEQNSIGLIGMNQNNSSVLNSMQHLQQFDNLDHANQSTITSSSLFLSPSQNQQQQYFQNTVQSLDNTHSATVSITPENQPIADKDIVKDDTRQVNYSQVQIGGDKNEQIIESDINDEKNNELSSNDFLNLSPLIPIVGGKQLKVYILFIM